MALYYAGRIAVPSTSKQSLHERFTSFMKNRPSKLDVVATPAKASDRNQRLAAEMESRESVKSQIHPDEKKWHQQRHHPYGNFAQPYQQHHQHRNGGGGGGKEKGNKGRNKKNARKEQKSNENGNDNDEKARGKTKQPKVVPDQNELDAELDAYNKAREAKLQLEKNSTTDSAETAEDPLVGNGKEDEDILKESKPVENANDNKKQSD